VQPYARFICPQEQANESIVFGLIQILSIKRFVKVILRLVQRSIRDAQEPGELFRIIATESFGDVPRGRYL
jgi:hypothetical protein